MAYPLVYHDGTVCWKDEEDDPAGHQPNHSGTIFKSPTPPWNPATKTGFLLHGKRQIEEDEMEGNQSTSTGMQHFVPLPHGMDGVPIRPGDTVYGEDGVEWHVIGVMLGECRYCVVGASGDRQREMRPEWLTHERPRTAEDVVSEFGERIWNAFCRGTTWADSECDALAREYAGMLEVRDAR